MTSSKSGMLQLLWETPPSVEGRCGSAKNCGDGIGKKMQ
jgi:hypothetical protein